MANYTEVGNPKIISASGLVKTGAGSLVGIFVSSSGASSKIAVTDGTASALSTTSGLVVKPFTATAGTFFRLPASFGTGLFISMSGSARTATVFFSPAS